MFSNENKNVSADLRFESVSEVKRDLEQVFVVLVEGRAVELVDELRHSDDGAVRVLDRHAQDGARVEP